MNIQIWEERLVESKVYRTLWDLGKSWGNGILACLTAWSILYTSSVPCFDVKKVFVWLISCDGSSTDWVEGRYVIRSSTSGNNGSIRWKTSIKGNHIS